MLERRSINVNPVDAAKSAQRRTAVCVCSWRRSVNVGTGVLRATGGQPSAPARSGVRMSTPEARRAAAKERLAASKGLSPREVEPMIQEAEPAPAVTAHKIREKSPLRGIFDLESKTQSLNLEVLQYGASGPGSDHHRHCH